MKQERNTTINIGRAVEIDQRDNPREYQREYQRLWRAKHKHYYRDKRRLKKKTIIGDNMKGLKELQNAWNLFLVKCIEVHYKTSDYNEDELKKLAEDVTNKITDCLEEMKNEREVNNEIDNTQG